jgi:hypothetical protein
MSRQRYLRLFLALVVFGTAGYLLRGYTTDDTFIHLRFAENLLQRGEFSFNPGEQTYGATSPLWVFGLALLIKIGIAPMTAAWVFGAICGLIMILAADAIVERLTFAYIWKILLMLLVASDVWFLRWSFSGMETPLATALLVILLIPLVSPRVKGPMWHRYLWWGVGAGLAGLVRPEFLVMVPLALPLLLWFEYFRAGGMDGATGRYLARPHKPLLAGISGWLLVVMPWLIFAWFQFGRIFPETASAKSVGFTLNPVIMYPYLYRAIGLLAIPQGFLWAGLVLLIILILRRHQFLERYYNQDREPGYQPPLEDDAPLERVDLGPKGTGLWSVWGPVAMVGITATWVAVLVGGLAMRQVWVISRYVCPLTPVMLLAMSVVVEWLMEGVAVTVSIRKTGRVIILTAVIATLALNWWIFAAEVLPHARKFPLGVQECFFDLGTWLRDNTPENTVVAAADIGAIGYASERRVLDLMGLVSPRILELGREMGFQEMVDTAAWLKIKPGPGETGQVADYLVDRNQGTPRWSGKTVHGVRFELLDSCTIEGMGLSEPEPWTVSLYRLVPADTSVKSSTGR